MTAVAQPGAGAGAPVLAVDVGGTQLKSAVLDQAGALGTIHRTPTPRSVTDPGGAVVEAVADLVAEARRRGGIEAIGVTVPGLVNEEAGIGILSTNLGWRDFPFTAVLRRATGLPVALAHDVRAAGEAEHRIGAAAGFSDVAVVIIGTGIAAALRLNGQSYTGRGLAGELGHSVVDPDGPVCRCGNRGCLEAIASAGALARRFAEAGGSTSKAAEVLRLAAAGDPLARRIWDEALHALTIGLAQLCALVAPEVILLGGGLTEAGDQLFGPLPGLLRAARGSAPTPPILPARLGQDAGTWGAALAARDLLQRP
ncbi:MAG: ROK family protein [Propionicimonas sp.]|jgi:glucokinase